MHLHNLRFKNLYRLVKLCMDKKVIKKFMKKGENMKLPIILTRRFLIAGATLLSMAMTPLSAMADDVKVAGIFTLPVDQQWISRIHIALDAAQERGDIEYVYSENVSNTDYERVMREYAESGVNLIVGEVLD